MSLRPPSPAPRERDRAAPAVAQRRSGLGWSAIALVTAAGIYAAVSFLGDSLPDAVEPAFSSSVVRWIAIGVAAVAVLAIAGIERRRVRALTAFASELQRGEDLERKAEDAAALTEASRGLNRAAPDHITEAVARGAAVTIGAARACMFAHDEDRNVMVPVGWTAGATFDEQPMDTPVGRAAIQRQPILTNDPQPSNVCAPVIVAGELAGVVLAIAQGKRYGDRELRLLASYATDASVAIARASALQQERKIAERLTEIDRAKSDFVAAVSHELKTPLTSLLGYASILRKRVDALPKDRREQFFEIIQRQGERILRLIGELLESSRMESGLARMQREHIDVGGLIKAVVKDMKPAAKRHTIEVSLPDKDPELWGDPAALEHIVTNLLDNAIKYSPKRTTVRVAIESAPSEIRLAVSDQGYGIAPEDLPYIFDRFRQGDDVHRTAGSVGLGLFIVRSLAEAQGGHVSCESQSGKGSTFTVTFPRRAKDRVAMEARDAASGGDPVITIGSSNGAPAEPAGSVDAATVEAIVESHEAPEKR